MQRMKGKQALGLLHPGQFVRTRIVELLGLSVKDAALAPGVHRVALSRFLDEAACLSPDMAIRLERAFGASMEDLMRMQNDYDIALAHEREADIRVVRYVPKDAPRNAQPELL